MGSPAHTRKLFGSVSRQRRARGGRASAYDTHVLTPADAGPPTRLQLTHRICLAGESSPVSPFSVNCTRPNMEEGAGVAAAVAVAPLPPPPLSMQFEPRRPEDEWGGASVVSTG